MHLFTENTGAYIEFPGWKTHCTSIHTCIHINVFIAHFTSLLPKHLRGSWSKLSSYVHLSGIGFQKRPPELNND